MSSPGGASGGGGAGELGSRCVTGGAQKQLIDVTEKDKGGQDNFRAHAQIVGRLELPFRRHEEGSVEQ